MPPQTVKLNTGTDMPIIGLGTWKSKPGEVELAVEHALKVGYKHIDTAAAYGNEREVGQGIKASGVPREEMFLTTKLNNIDHSNPEEALLASLEKLNTPYLDLWLMHWPAPMTKDWKKDENGNWIQTWQRMEALYQKYPEKLKAIGVSNVSIEYLEELLKVATVIPAINQVELHPANPQIDLVELCGKHGIHVTAYSPLGSDNSPLLTHEVVKKVADNHGVHPANILVSLQACRPNVNVLVKSVKKNRIEANLTLVDLTQSEIDELLEIDKTLHFRACTPEWTGWGSLGFPDRK